MNNMYNDDDRLYLQMMQENISRMANNSLSCKTWMVSIVSAFLAVSCGIESLNGWIVLALIPVFVFWYLDTYYLHLERGMRNRQKDFLNKFGGEFYAKALFNFAPLKLKEDDKDAGLVSTNNRMFSESTAPFYCSIVGVILVISIVLNWDFIVRIFSCEI